MERIGKNEGGLKRQQLHFFICYYCVITMFYETQKVWIKNIIFIQIETRLNKISNKSETRPRPLKSDLETVSATTLVRGRLRSQNIIVETFFSCNKITETLVNFLSNTNIEIQLLSRS